MLKIIYVLATLFIVIFVGLIGGIMDIIQSDNVIKVADKLQYPLYFFTLLGIFKISGALILLLPNRFKTLHMLAYSGFSYDFIFASYSHYSINDSTFAIIFPLIVLFILLTSFFLKNEYSFYKKKKIY